MRLAPDSGYLYFLILGRAYFFFGDTDSAVLYLRQAVERNAVGIKGHLFFAATVARAGQRDTAAWETQEIRTLEPAFNARKRLQNYPMANPGQRNCLVEANASLNR